MDAAARKAARAHWETRVFRGADQGEQADYDALFWDRIPLDERAEAVWQVSEEMHAIARQGRHEPGLPRSAFRIERR